MQLWTGTSGYSYPEWKGSFYPEDLADDGMLGYYGEQLPAVEINNTFYRMPKRSVVEKWAAAVPEEFRFCIKASRRITHQNKLADVDELLFYLYRSLDQLGEKLGCVLYQLPKWVRKDTALLDGFLGAQPEGRRVALEFGHDSWFDDAVAEVLRAHNAAYCGNDREDRETPVLPATADWGYLRLRRREYPDDELIAWCAHLRGQGWQRAFVFFKHEEDCAGPDLARRFRAIWDRP